MTAANNARDNLVRAWKDVTSDGPLTLPADRAVLSDFPEYTVTYDSFESYSADPRFGLLDHRLHLGLVPVPYVGNLMTSDVFLLLLNPGLHAGDYFAEYRQPDFRHLMFQNLHQELSVFPFLQPELSWHPGGNYWLGRFRGLAKELGKDLGSVQKARQLLSQRIACVELVPYHSPEFGLPPKLVRRLESVQLVKLFVKEHLEPRAQRGEVLIIVARQVRKWGLAECQHIVLYDRSRARGGSISPNTPGGRAILDFLRLRPPLSELQAV